MITSICEKHLEREFIRELSPNIKCFDLMDFEYNHDSIPTLDQKLDFISQQQRLASYMSPIGVSPTWSLQVDLHVKSKI
ncbi:unnamed protein product [Rhizophagus irregularis]|nr:unnamed protein product [Rhizophagus irregularis]